MEKQLTMRGGQTPVQRYWPTLLPLIQQGVLKPSIVITHVMPLEDGQKGYDLFNDKKDGCVKVILQPGATEAVTKPPASAPTTS